MSFQAFSDTLIERTLLPFIPHSISPNQVSWLRILALPFIYYLLIFENYLLGFVLFAIAALTDALDGAMARKRNRVTEAGKILDAVADRGLIALVAILFIGSREYLAACCEDERLIKSEAAVAASSSKKTAWCRSRNTAQLAVRMRRTAYFIPKYFGWPMLTALATLEAFNATMAYLSRRKPGFNPGANGAGK